MDFCGTAARRCRNPGIFPELSKVSCLNLRPLPTIEGGGGSVAATPSASLCPVGATAERLENSSRIHSFVHHHAEEGEHHLFPSHVAVIDGLVRIGIEFIISGIIVMRRDDKLGALWDSE